MMAFICFSVFVFIVVFLSSIAVGGWSLSLEKTKFNLKNISPIEGVKRIFSFNNLFECVKSILKITVVIVAFCFLAKASYLKATSAGTFFESAQLLLTFTLTIAGSLVIIVLIDIPYQLWQHLQNSKMSRRELQDELKESELSREQKQRLREHSDQNIRKDNRGKEWMIS
jgi:flagellar biosynthetic protein FlhB